MTGKSENTFFSFQGACFILTLMVLFGVLSACEKERPLVEKVQPPNIVWLVAEDQAPEWFPMYGNSTIGLPTLEALAADGVVFTNAVSPVPVCAPARSAIITGMYPTSLGTHNMRTYTPWRDVNEPLLDSLPSYSPMVPQGVRMFTEYLRERGYYTANGPKEDYNFEKTDVAWDESSGERHWRKRTPDQPFFAVFNFSVCHESQIWKRSGDSLFVNPKDVPVPPMFPDTPTVRHDLAVNYSNLKRLDDQIAAIISDLKEDGLYEDTYIFFYGDHGGPFPRYKRALYDTGVQVPMVIKFPRNKRAGEKDDRLFSFLDLAPSVLSIAGIRPPAVMQGKGLFGDFASSTPSEYTYHSSDRFDEIYDRLRAVRSKRFKYIKSYNTQLSHAIPVSYREQMAMMQELRAMDSAGTLNGEQARWLAPEKPAEELYDLTADPYELHNLASLPAYSDTLAFYRGLLSKWEEDTGDLGRIPERDLISKWLPQGSAPQLGAVTVTEKNGLMYLHPPKSDATISWKPIKDSVWQVYTDALEVNVPIMVKAERIGYRDSEVLKLEPK